MELTKRKKFILKLTIVLVAFLLICTVLSRTIYTILLPRVELVSSQSGKITNQVTASGKIVYSDEVKTKSVGEMKILDVLVKPNQEVKKGDVLMSVDTTQNLIDLKRLELSLVQKQNMLIPAAISPERKAELELQLRIAKMELDLFKMNHEIERELNGKRHEATLLSYKEKSEEAYAELSNAVAQLRDYEGDSSAQEQQLRLSVLRASHQLLIADIDEVDKTAAQINYQISLEEYQNFTVNYEIEGVLDEERINLKILQYQAMLKPEELTKQQKQEIKMQIEIAKIELDNFKKLSPTDGNIRAESSGTVSVVGAKKGDIIQSGQVLISILSPESKPIVQWSSSYDAGFTYVLGDAVEVIVKEIDGYVVKNKSYSVKIESRMLDEQTNQWIFTAYMEPTKAIIAEIIMSRSSDSYDIIVPLAAIQKDVGGNDVIRMVAQRRGLFAEEDYIVEEVVEILEKNNTVAAIKSSRGYMDTKVVQYTNKPLSNGAIVSVVDGN